MYVAWEREEKEKETVKKYKRVQTGVEERSKDNKIKINLVENVIE